jgi:hypothetical protein
MPVMPSLTPDSLMLCRWAQSPALTLTIIHTRARARLARQGSARCYGVARQRERSRQNSIGGSGVLSLRHFGLVLLIRWRVGAEGIWRGEDRFRPARCCSTGSGRLGGAGRTMERSLAAPSPI